MNSNQQCMIPGTINMKQTMVIFSIILIILNPSLLSSNDLDTLEGEIEVNISGIRNQNGLIRLLIFNTAEGFPSEHQKSYTMRNVNIEQDSLTVTLSVIPFNTYAISVLHDENSNGKLDTNWVGIPQEGVGVSNNVKSRLGPPKFRDSVFTLNSKIIIQSIKINYY